jgi:nicotinate-nucleotide adenylyltransferase
MAAVGIFAGTFDPVHNGHVAFALSAIETSGLDTVVFLPERQPRGKRWVTPLTHRVAMLRLIVRAQPRFAVLVLPDTSFTVAHTLPRLQSRYSGHDLALLVGSDVAQRLPTWADADVLFAAARIIIGQRHGDSMPALQVPADFLPTMHAHVAASRIRSGQAEDIAPQVREYIHKHHLYGV